MKSMCRCGSLEDLKIDKPITGFEFKSCGYGIIAFICKNCSEVVSIKVKNNNEKL